MYCNFCHIFSSEISIFFSLIFDDTAVHRKLCETQIYVKQFLPHITFYFLSFILMSSFFLKEMLILIMVKNSFFLSLTCKLNPSCVYSYCMSKKSWPNLYSNLLYKMSQGFLDWKYVYNSAIVLGALEINANLYCNFVHLYWEGCVI